MSACAAGIRIGKQEALPGWLGAPDKWESLMVRAIYPTLNRFGHHDRALSKRISLHGHLPGATAEAVNCRNPISVQPTVADDQLVVDAQTSPSHI